MADIGEEKMLRNVDGSGEVDLLVGLSPPGQNPGPLFSARRRFLEMTLREIFSPSRPLICDFGEKNATRSDKKEEVGAALYNTHLPPPL